MKFKFCAGGDCPLWALSALHAAAALPAPIFRQLADHVSEEAGRGAADEDRILEILKDTPLNSRTEAARAAAVVRWVLACAWRTGCAGAALSRDLHLLGAPRHHAVALADAADRHRASYTARAAEERFMVNRVTDVSAEEGPPGTVDVLRLSVRTDDVFTRQQQEHELLVPKDMAAILLQDLKRAYSKMEQMEML